MSNSTLAAFKEKLEAAAAPTPLWVYLYIYHKSRGGCYTSYMEGAKALYKFLSPIAIPTCYDGEEFQLPTYMYGYESDEMATILVGEDRLVRTCQHQDIQNIIIHTTFNEVLPRL